MDTINSFFNILIILSCFFLLCLLSTLKLPRYVTTFNNILCDNECRQFHEFMTSPSWPFDKPKGAIYILTQRSRKSNLHAILKSVDKFFNNRYKYPIVIFHERESPPFDKEAVKSMTKSALFFQEVNFEMPYSVNKSLVPKFATCNTLNSIGYRHMCRFHAKGVFELDILKVLQYIWRLDDDSLLTRPIRYDLFRYMEGHNVQYAYHFVASESRMCIQGLWETVDKYIASNHTGMTKAYASWNRDTIYFNNFEMSNISIWFSESYRDFVDYIDRTGHIYYTRWGDAPIKTIAVNLFVPEDGIYYFKDVGYLHDNDKDNQWRIFHQPWVTIQYIRQMERRGLKRLSLWPVQKEHLEAPDSGRTRKRPQLSNKTVFCKIYTLNQCNYI